MNLTLETARKTYVNTDNMQTRMVMEAVIVRLQREESRKRNRENRELLNIYRHCRYHYANTTSPFVRAKIEAALPRIYRTLIEKGLDPSCIAADITD